MTLAVGLAAASLALLGVAVIALVAARRRGGRGRPAADGRIDPFALGEPWRHHVAAMQASQRRFRALVTSTASLALRARLAEIGLKIDRSVLQCWEIARAASGIDTTIRLADTEAVQARLARASSDRETVSLRAQLAAVQRLTAARDDADARLRLMTARIGEIVGRGAELQALRDADEAALRRADEPSVSLDRGHAELDVDDVLVELEALRAALEEIDEPFAAGLLDDSEPTG